MVIRLSNMIISLIAAVDQNYLIGNGSNIPWNLPADRKHFRDMTLGKPVVMGRKTFETLDRPLDKRINIILTRNFKYEVPSNCFIAHSLGDVFNIADDAEELMVCGGAPIYQAFLPYAHTIYLTKVHAEFEGNIYFPKFDPFIWKEVECINHEPDEDNPYSYSFFQIEKKVYLTVFSSVR